MKSRSLLEWIQLAVRPSGWLELTLVLKIVFTIVWIVLLLVAEWLFPSVRIPKPEPLIFVILLAGAFMALLVGYVRGYLTHRLYTIKADEYKGESIRTVVIVGIVSNGWATLTLLAFGLFGAWNGWGGRGGSAMWVSTLVAGIVTAGLVAAWVAPGDDYTLAKPGAGTVQTSSGGPLVAPK